LAAAQKAANNNIVAEKATAEKVRADNDSPTEQARADKGVAQRAANRKTAEPDAPKKEDGPKASGPKGRFEVVHERVIIRDMPSTSSNIAGALTKGKIVQGTPHDNAGIPWLLLAKGTQEIAVQAKSAWVLMDGATIGLGLLLKPLGWEGVQMTIDIPDQEPEGGRLWRVVGGEGKGGIMVRKGEEFTSKPLNVRLATGTLVEEIEVSGNRLHFKRIRGNGPDWGWVNIELDEKVLMQLQ